jgi:hypothetical protein
MCAVSQNLSIYLIAIDSELSIYLISTPKETSASRRFVWCTARHVTMRMWVAGTICCTALVASLVCTFFFPYFSQNQNQNCQHRLQNRRLLEQGSESIAVAGWYSGLRPGVSSAPGCRLPLPGKFLPLAGSRSHSHAHTHTCHGGWWVMDGGHMASLGAYHAPCSVPHPYWISGWSSSAVKWGVLKPYTTSSATSRLRGPLYQRGCLSALGI